MNRIFIFLPICIFFFVACANNESSEENQQTPVSMADENASLQEDIKKLETTLKSQKDARLNKPAALELIAKSEAFASAFPDDPKAATVLFQAADVARGIGEYELAIKHWQTVNQKYPTFERSPDAAFLVAFTYENDLQNKEKAKSLYNAFLANYPDHQLVPQIEQLLKVIDKTPEELIKEFQKKNAQ